MIPALNKNKPMVVWFWITKGSNLQFRHSCFMFAAVLQIRTQENNNIHFLLLRFAEPFPDLFYSSHPFLWRLPLSLAEPLFVTLKRKGMKTFFIFSIACLCSLFSNAQEQKTSINDISVITTSSGTTAAQLTWKKGDENIAYFIVERSTDGVDFKQCGIVFLSDNPDFVQYKFRDKITSNTHGLLYRIGIVNEQKRLSYLPVKKLVLPDTL